MVKAQDESSKYLIAKNLFETKLYKEAYEKLQPLIKLKDPNALNLVGIMYDFGLGVKQNHIKSFNYYKEASSFGSVKGLYNLAVAYDYGEGVKINKTLAHKLYEQAANKGSPYGYYALAQNYYYGNGVKSEINLALANFHLAHDQGVHYALIDISEIYQKLGQYGDAEKAILQAIQLEPESKVLNLSSVGNKSNSYFIERKRQLAQIYSSQGRENEAIPIWKTILKQNEKYHGVKSEEVAHTMQNLAIAMCSVGFSEKGIEYLNQSMSIYKTIYKKDNWYIANGLGNLGHCYHSGTDKENLKIATNYYLDSIKVFQDCCDDDLYRSYLFLGNLAEAYQEQGLISLARAAFIQARENRMSSVGGSNVDIVDLNANFAKFEISQSNYEEACEILKVSYDVFARNFSTSLINSSLAVRGVMSDEDVGLIYAICLLETDMSKEKLNNSFKAIQLSKAYGLDNSLDIASLQPAFEEHGVSELIVNLKEVERNLKHSIDQLIILDEENTDNLEVIFLQKKIKKLSAKKSSIVNTIGSKFPQYNNLTNPKPLGVMEAQKLLTSEEALFTFVSDEDTGSTYAFLVTKDLAQGYKINLSNSEISTIVTEIRTSVDLSKSVSTSNIPVFDMDLSYKLFNELLGPVSNILESIKHLIVVPTGPLESLPLNLLITTKPKVNHAVSIFENYRSAAWLPKKYSLTRLPTLSSFRALHFNTNTAKLEPFIGFGDPVLKGSAGKLRGLKMVDIYEGANVNLERLRGLPELPQTSTELLIIANHLKASTEKIFLQERATELLLKNTDLSTTRVIAFATHGLISGDIIGLSEPALVMTPPVAVSGQDDGLLRASEIALLKLNADIIILSACNTASSTEPGAKGLSGLAQAFIYAGAQSLLVSHWSIESESAAAITTGLFDIISKNSAIGRSEALQLSIVNLILDKNRPYYSHPAFWAPFTLLGNGQTSAMY